MARKKSSDEAIIAALLTHGTITGAAEACGISARTVYGRLEDREFRVQYMRAKNDILRRATLSMCNKLSAAVDTVFEIMNDAETSPAIRLQAAQTFIANAGKLSDRLKDDEAASMEEAHPHNPWDLF